MVDKFAGVIPEGTQRARIRFSRRETRDPASVGEGTLAETLGDESVGIVIIDPSGGHPMKYDELSLLEGFIASTNVRIELDVEGEGGRGWKRTGSVIDTQNDADLGAGWARDISTGAKYILEHSYVTGGDDHYDARLFPHVHPYGTGSVRCERGSGGIQHHTQNRLCQIQSFFRRSAMYGFWSLNRLLMTQLFNMNRRRRHFGRRTASSATDSDPFTRIFGTASPSSIPESTEWWRKQSRELFATVGGCIAWVCCVLLTSQRSISP